MLRLILVAVAVASLAAGAWFLIGAPRLALAHERLQAAQDAGARVQKQLESERENRAAEQAVMAAHKANADALRAVLAQRQGALTGALQSTHHWAEQPVPQEVQDALDPPAQ
jgi:hypothetical protein